MARFTSNVGRKLDIRVGSFLSLGVYNYVNHNSDTLDANVLFIEFQSIDNRVLTYW